MLGAQSLRSMYLESLLHSISATDGLNTAAPEHTRCSPGTQILLLAKEIRLRNLKTLCNAKKMLGSVAKQF